MQSEALQENLRRGLFIICWENLLPLIGLNLLFLICCLPIVTIPAAVTALARSLQGCLLGEGHLFRRYKETFPGAFRRTILTGLLFLAAMIGLLYCVAFYIANSAGNIPLMACAIFCVIAFYLVFCLGIYTAQLFAADAEKGRDALRGAVRLLVQSPRLLFTWLFLAFGVLAVLVWFFPYTLPLLATVGFSLSGVFATRGVLPAVIDFIEEGS